MPRHFVRYHPIFPTTVEAAANYNLVTSDHVPLLAYIDDLTVLTWNVLQFDSGNGFASLEDGLSANETDEQKSARHARIVTAIKRFADRHQPHFIALQEITDKDPQLLDSILATLGDEYGCVHRDDGMQSKTGGVVTLFRRSALAHDPEHRNINNRIGTSSTHFTLTNGKTGRLFNVHPLYSQIIVHTETGISDYLLDQNENDDYAIVIGDFNAHIAPISETPQCITTSAAAPYFRDNKRQGAAAVDGAFYWLRQERRLTQAACDHLDPTTGQIIDLTDLAPLALDQLNEEQKEEVTLPRMVISLDYRHAERKFIDNKYTLLEYERILRDKYNTKSIYVRLARDLNNEEPHIAIAYPSVILKNPKWVGLKSLHQSILSKIGTAYRYDDDYARKNYTVVYLTPEALKLDADDLPIKLTLSSSVSEESDNETNSDEADQQPNFFKRNLSAVIILCTAFAVAGTLALTGGLSLPALALLPFVSQVAATLLVSTQTAAGLLVGGACLLAAGASSLISWGIIKATTRQNKSSEFNKIPEMPLVYLPPTPPRSPRSPSISARHFSTSTSRLVPPLKLQQRQSPSNTPPSPEDDRTNRLSTSSTSSAHSDNDSFTNSEIDPTEEVTLSPRQLSPH